MTIAYYTQREQISRGNADRAASVPARVAHLALAAAYGALVITLKAASVPRYRRQRNGSEPNIARWEDEGGSSR